MTKEPKNDVAEGLADPPDLIEQVIATQERLSRNGLSPVDGHAGPHWMAVLAGLARHDLLPLAAHLRRCNGRIDPLTAHILADMIDGPKEKSGYRLVLGRHPELGSWEKTAEAQQEDSKRAWDVTTFLIQQGGLERGKLDAACVAATAKFGLSRSSIMQIWSANREGVLRVHKWIGSSIEPESKD